jgi:hypothetical protein
LPLAPATDLLNKAWNDPVSFLLMPLIG